MSTRLFNCFKIEHCCFCFLAADSLSTSDGDDLCKWLKTVLGTKAANVKVLIK